MRNSLFTCTLTWPADEDPVSPTELPEDLPHVYDVTGEIYDLDDRGPGVVRRPKRTHDESEIGIKRVARVEPDGSETEIHWCVWVDAEEALVAAVIADLEGQHDGWDGGA